MIIYYIIMSFVFLYLFFNVAYLLLFSVAGMFRRKSRYSSVSNKNKTVVLIPTYKEDAIIIETAQNAIRHNYPRDLFDVVIIADQLQESTLNTLSKLPVRLVKVSFEKSTKAKSLKYALLQLPDQYYDIVLILDADNIMGEDCIEKVNHAFNMGHEMVQLHRTAKNRNTPTAILDAASEEINNHIFRQGHRALGISSALIGSGMAFRYTDFKTLMMETDIENNPGEDREIYLELLKQGKICEYIEDALVYDEKVQSGQVLEKQRTRWLSAQLQYAKRFWIKEFIRTFSYNIHYFDYALQTLLLPRIMLLMTTMMLAISSLGIHLITGFDFYPGFAFWIALFAGCTISIMFSTYRYVSFKDLLSALGSLPKTSWSFFKALLRSSSDQQEFIHTPKDFNNISTPL